MNVAYHHLKVYRQQINCFGLNAKQQYYDMIIIIKTIAHNHLCIPFPPQTFQHTSNPIFSSDPWSFSPPFPIWLYIPSFPLTHRTHSLFFFSLPPKTPLSGSFHPLLSFPPLIFVILTNDITPVEYSMPWIVGIDYSTRFLHSLQKIRTFLHQLFSFLVPPFSTYIAPFS